MVQPQGFCPCSDMGRILHEIISTSIPLPEDTCVHKGATIKIEVFCATSPIFIGKLRI